MKLAPHLHRLGNDIVASYLIDLPDGITLVDAGLPGHWKDLQRELEVIGRPLSDVRGLVLTHGDSDHIGFAERLRQKTGVPVFIHRADAHRVRTGERPKTPMGPAHLRPLVKFFAYGLRKNAVRTRQVQEVVEVADGDVLGLPGSPVVIGMPGHSPGSIGLWEASTGTLFSGDAIYDGPLLDQLDGSDVEAYVATVERLRRLPVTVVHGGHEPSFGRARLVELCDAYLAAHP